MEKATRGASGMRAPDLTPSALHAHHSSRSDPDEFREPLSREAIVRCSRGDRRPRIDESGLANAGDGFGRVGEPASLQPTNRPSEILEGDAWQKSFVQLNELVRSRT